MASAVRRHARRLAVGCRRRVHAQFPDAARRRAAGLRRHHAERFGALAGREFVVSNREEAMCVAGEGELPFAFGAGYPAPLVDLRATEGAGFASIDYSETPPLVFVGESLPFTSFGFANLRGAAAAKPAGVVKALNCPRCGSAISIHDKAVQSVACPSCLTVLEHDNSSLRILHKAITLTRIEPRSRWAASAASVATNGP
jgi:ribosomal protein S27E